MQRARQLAGRIDARRVHGEGKGGGQDGKDDERVKVGRGQHGHTGRAQPGLLRHARKRVTPFGLVLVLLHAGPRARPRLLHLHLGLVGHAAFYRPRGADGDCRRLGHEATLGEQHLRVGRALFVLDVAVAVAVAVAAAAVVIVAALVAAAALAAASLLTALAALAALAPLGLCSLPGLRGALGEILGERVQQDGDEEVHNQVDPDQHREGEEEGRDRAAGASRRLHGLRPFARQQHKDGGHRRLKVVKVEARQRRERRVRAAGRRRRADNARLA